MDRMAAIAEQHYKTHLPERYAALDDPETYFQMLSDEAEEQIEAMLPGLEGPDLPNETFLERVSRYNWARFLAESQVFREVLLPAPEEETDPEEAELNQQIVNAIRGFNEAASQLPSREPPPE